MTASIHWPTAVLVAGTMLLIALAGGLAMMLLKRIDLDMIFGRK